MSSVSHISGGTASGSGSGCDVWGSANKGATPSGSWGVDVDTIPPVVLSTDNAASNINVEETITRIKTDLKFLLNCQDKEKLVTITSISERVDSLRKLLQVESECHERKPDNFQKICDSVMISSLLECGHAILRGKGAQLLYHLFKREDQISTPAYGKLKEKLIFTNLVTLVDKCDAEVAKFWGLCALEFILRMDSTSRKSFMTELDGVGIVIRVKDGYSHSVDLQNATDRVLISLEKGDREVERNFGDRARPVQQPPPQYRQQQQQRPYQHEDRRTSRDFPVVGVWQPPPPPTATTTTSTTTTPSGNQATVLSTFQQRSGSASTPPAGPSTTFAIGAWCQDKP